MVDTREIWTRAVLADVARFCPWTEPMAAMIFELFWTNVMLCGLLDVNGRISTSWLTIHGSHRTVSVP